MKDFDWADVPAGEVFEWQYPNPTGYTHIVVDVAGSQVHYRDTGEWESEPHDGCERMLAAMEQACSNTDPNWRKLERPKAAEVQPVDTGNEPLNALEDELIRLIYAYRRSDFNDTFADTVRDAFDELRGRRVDSDSFVPVTVSEDRGE